MVNLGLFVGLPILILGSVFVVYSLALRSRYHYTSSLTCPKCGRSFDYKWVPGASFSAFRLGKDRDLQCPLCKEWSTFDIRGAKVDRASPGGSYPQAAKDAL